MIEHNLQDIQNDTVLWRYFDLVKFIDLIERKQLFFSSLSSMKDQYDGRFLYRYDLDIVENFKKLELKNCDSNVDSDRIIEIDRKVFNDYVKKFKN